MDEEEILRLTQQTYGDNTSSTPDYYVEDPYGYSGGTGNATPYIPPYYVEDPYGHTGGTEVTTPPGGSLVPGSGGFNFADLFKGAGKSFLDYIEKNPGKVGIMAALAALGAMSKARPSGGGKEKAYVGPAQQLTRTITQGKYGPIAQSQYAAQGGIMHAYAHGGQVKPFPMQDGGFVMTEKAMKGAEETVPGGIYTLLPGARPIRGPGTGTSDSIPAYIQGRNGLTPARVSNGEGYIPPEAQPPGGTRELYAMMRQLERRD